MTFKMEQWEQICDLIGHSDVSAMHAIMGPLSDNVLFLERAQASTIVRAQGVSENGNEETRLNDRPNSRLRMGIGDPWMSKVTCFTALEGIYLTG